MAGASLTTLQASVEDNIKRTDKTSDVVAQINAAILDVAMTVRPTDIMDFQTGSTTAGTDTYALDSDNLYIEQVCLTNVGQSSAGEPVIVNRGNLRSWMLRNRASTARGVPTLWHRRNDNIELYDAIPDTNGGNQYTYEIAYLKQPAILVATSPSTTMDLGEEWNQAVEYLATAKMFRKLQDEREQIYLSAYAGILQIRQDPKSGEAKSDDDAHANFL